jgi:hypothetical protein
MTRHCVFVATAVIDISVPPAEAQLSSRPRNLT